MEDENWTVADATRALFELYRSDVFKYARHMLGSIPEAEDVTQEVFTRVFQSWNDFAQQSQAQTWVWSIARNHIYDVMRKKQRVARLVDMEARAEEVPAPPLDTSMLELQDAIRSLRPKYRQVVILRYIQDKPIAETSRLLGWTETKVRITCHRALKELRSILNGGEIMPPRVEKEGDSFGL